MSCSMTEIYGITSLVKSDCSQVILKTPMILGWLKKEIQGWLTWLKWCGGKRIRLLCGIGLIGSVIARWSYWWFCLTGCCPYYCAWFYHLGPSYCLLIYLFGHNRDPLSLHVCKKKDSFILLFVENLFANFLVLQIVSKGIICKCMYA